VVKCLPRKPEALSSNPSANQKKAIKNLPRHVGSLWFISVTLFTWEAEIVWIAFGGQPCQTVHETNLQNSQSKMDWRCGSSSKVLLCKHETLSSNPSPTKKEKNLPRQTNRRSKQFVMAQRSCGTNMKVGAGLFM
jgi:hypothetical protein